MSTASHVRRLIKKTTIDFGAHTEKRFFDAVNGPSASHFPRWLHGIGRGSKEDDWHRGIDAIAYTDVGEIHIQIKSSWKEAKKFKEGRHCRRNQFFVILVIKLRDESDQIYDLAIRELKKTRQHILALRGHRGDW